MAPDMQQVPIFSGDEAAHLESVKADVAAAGGFQVIGSRLGYGKDPIGAGKILSNKLAIDQPKHVLSAWDEKLIRRWARDATGRSQSFADEADMLRADVKFKTSEQIVQEQLVRQASAREAWEAEMRRTEKLLKELVK